MFGEQSKHEITFRKLYWSSGHFYSEKKLQISSLEAIA